MAKVQKGIDRSRLQDHDPILLEHAADIAFPDGSMSKRLLLKEAHRGTLQCEVIAGRTYTSLNAIELMREKCRESQKAHACGSVNDPAENRFGSSSTQAHLNSARDAAKMIALALKKGSKNT